MMRRAFVTIGLLLAATACGGAGTDASADGGNEAPIVDQALAAEDENPPVIVTTTLASEMMKAPRARDRECIGAAPLCEDEPDACSPEHLDEPDESIEAAGGLWSGITDSVGGLINAITQPIVDGAKNQGKDITLELSSYNSVPGYEIVFSCENPDGNFRTETYRGGTAVDLHRSKCSLETSKGLKKVKLGIQRSSDKKDVITPLVVQLAAPSLLLPSQSIANASRSFAIEGGLSVTIAFHSPGSQTAGLAGNARLLNVYLTQSKENWMRDMPARYRDLPLRGWALPGSHDAGMYTKGIVAHLPVVSTMALTQEESIAQQLRLGMRYFDVRPAKLKVGDGDVYAVHTVIPGASYKAMVEDALEFLTKEGKDEIVIFHESAAGIDTTAWNTDRSYITPLLLAALEKFGLPRSFVGDELALNLSPDQLRKLKRRFIVVDRAPTQSTWGSANEKPETLAAYVRGRAADCVSDTAQGRNVFTELQLQATAPHAIVNTLLSNKLVLDRSYLPWLAGGFAACATGPTVFLNDFVDNALTDVIERGLKRGEIVDDRWVKGAKPFTLSWAPGKLTLRGAQSVASRDYALSHGAGGDLTVYRLARDPATGRICKRAAIWTAPGRGDRVEFQTDGNLVLYDGDEPRFASNTAGVGADLYLSSGGELSVRDKAENIRFVRQLRDAAPGLSCDAAPEEVVVKSGTLSWDTVASQESATQRLSLQTDGNLVLYRLTRGPGGAVCHAVPTWSSGMSEQEARVVFERDGNLVMRDPNNKVKWSTATGGNPEASLRMGLAGLSIVAKDGRPLWTAGDGTRGGLCDWRDLDDSASKETMTWKRGELEAAGWRIIAATKTTVANFERGELVIYRVARAESGAVCAKKALWRAGRANGGEAARLRFDGNGLSITERRDGGEAWWKGDAAGADRLVLDGEGLHILDEHGSRAWSSNAIDRALLSCSGS